MVFLTISKECQRFSFFFLFVWKTNYQNQHTETDVTFLLPASTPKPTVRQRQFDL